MGISTFIEGVIPADEDWHKHLDAWDACKAVGVTPPDELVKYFGLEDEHQQPSRRGRVVEIPFGRFTDADREADGLELCLKAIPPGVTVVRFVRQA